MRLRSSPLAMSAALAAASLLRAVPPEAVTTPGKEAPPIEHPADAVNAMKSFQFDAGLKVELFAAEPQLQNPVAFSPDEQGRWYVSETFRQERGVEDNRAHRDWMNDDVASRSLDDRLAMMRKFYPDGKKFTGQFESEQERITRLEDTNADGAADQSIVFADGFRDALDGTAAGIVARGKEVWWTCIPNLWRFEDSNGDGRTDAKDKLLTGFGVKFAYRGHDMHGLRFGPDGKLYFSIGDRGINVTSKEGRKFEYADTGCIMRCNPDGTDFEVFAIGLRNPQELAFNEFGDLFTGDNNSDAGDLARFVQLVEGGDCGWRTTFQYLPDRGPWNREKLWDEKEGRNAKYLIPAIANLSDGPSGLTYNPGTALGEKYRGQFYLSDFRGGANQSLVHRIALEPAGAWHRLKERQDFVKGILTTDVEFGPDGGLYVLDWVESWGGVKKGRIYRFTDPGADQKLIEETKKLIGEGMGGRAIPDLVKLLAHPDQRVRQAAQFDLARKGKEAAGPMAKAAQAGPGTLARIHAVWGLGQIGEDAALSALVPLLADGDAEVRAQCAKVLGDRRYKLAAEKLAPLLSDASGRVRFHAALALGKLRWEPATDALFQVLAENGDQDPILRHGAVMGLAGCAKPEQLAAKAGDGNAAVRAGAVVALRRMGDPAVANFLKDADEAVVLEAARAIHDMPINPALPALARLLSEGGAKNPRILERAINAAYRLGGREQAAALAEFAGKDGAPEGSRKEALDALADWANPDPKDRLLNLWRPLPPRGKDDAVAAVDARLPALLKDAPDGVREQAAKVARSLGIKSAGQALADLVMNDSAAAGARTAALAALESLKDERLAKAAESAMGAKSGRLRAEGLRALAEADAGAAVRVIKEVLQKGSPRAQQGAVLALMQIDKPEAKEEIARLAARLIEGKCPPVIQLDVYNAAKKFGLDEQVQRVRDSRDKNDPLSNYRISLEGGDAGRGRKIFREKAEVSCLRCHKCEIGESAVGPDLTRIGAQKDRVYLLESIVFPNQHIADGFQTVSLTLKDKSVVIGRLLGEDGQNVRVETFDEKGQTQEKSVSVAEIAERASAPSPMPENVREQLSRNELRDLIEYLATRK